MVDIKWEDGAVCYAGGEQWYSCNENEVKLISENRSMLSFEEVLSFESFQLNEIRIGDELEVRSLDEYAKTIDVLSLFGFEPLSRHGGWDAMNPNPIAVVEEGYGHTIHVSPRKITYQQIMVIGKLKQAMVERDAALIDVVENTSILKDTLGAAKDYTPAGTIEGENTKESRAYNILESMNIFYDEEKEKWYKKEYL